MFSQKDKKPEKVENKISESEDSAVIESDSKKTDKSTDESSFFSLLRPVNPSRHDFTFGVVYANDLAKAEIKRENPNFPIGSIIVREKNASATSETPETVIAMVKRESGFNKETNDWEFFVFDGADLKMQKRETKGDCAACHIRAEKSDWVFRDYLK